MSVPDLKRNPDAAKIERVKLTSEYMKRAMALAVPGAYWHTEEKAYVCDDPSTRAAAVICRLFPELQDVHPELTLLRDELLKDARPFDNATSADLSIDATNVRALVEGGTCPRCPMLPDGTDPGCPICHGTLRGGYYPFQNTDLGYMAAVLRKHGSGEIAWDRGMGKTLGACSLIDDLVANRVLVVAPNTSKAVVWEDSLRRWLPDHRVILMPNGQPEKREKIIKDLAATVEPVVLVCHYEALNLVANTRTARRGWLRAGTWDIIVADESHRLANPQTKMHRALMQVPTDSKLSLTGSMIQNTPEEWFGRLRWLFPKVYRAKWRDWNDRYLEYVSSDYGKILIGPYAHRVDEMRQELGVFTVYRRQEDELDLPPRNQETVLVDLTPEQRTVYNELRDSCIATLSSGESVVGLQPVVLLTRLRQVASGLELVSGQVTGSSKMDVAIDRIRNSAENFVVFSWYKAAALAMGERLAAEGIDAQVVTGDTSHAKRRDAIRSFQAGTGGRCFVGTISTLGESVDLYHASQGIFLDRSWNPAQNRQAEDRYYRIGQAKPVKTTNIVARDTVDQLLVMPNLANKEQLRRMILGGV